MSDFLSAQTFRDPCTSRCGPPTPTHYRADCSEGERATQACDRANKRPRLQKCWGRRGSTKHKITSSHPHPLILTSVTVDTAIRGIQAELPLPEEEFTEAISERAGINEDRVNVTDVEHRTDDSLYTFDIEGNGESPDEPSAGEAYDSLQAGLVEDETTVIVIVSCETCRRTYPATTLSIFNGTDHRVHRIACNPAREVCRVSRVFVRRAPYSPRLGRERGGAGTSGVTFPFL